MSDDALIPLQDESETTGFDIGLRGYDRRQVDDYVDRVEVALSESDRQHTEDGERLATLEEQVTSLQSRLSEAEQRSAGKPEKASSIGERLATMLRLAEEESEQIIEQAHERAVRNNAERSQELDRREVTANETAAAAEQARLEAQRDADTLRLRAQQEAAAAQAAARKDVDAMVAQAREQSEVKRRQLDEEAHARSTEREDEARRQLDELTHQRDVIGGQLESLRETLAAVVGPLGGAEKRPSWDR